MRERESSPPRFNQSHDLLTENGVDMRIGITGFRRIGRNVATAIFEDDPEARIGGTNDVTIPADRSHLVGDEVAPDALEASLRRTAWESDDVFRTAP